MAVLAYGELDGYGASLKYGKAECQQMWGHPRSKEDIAELFAKYCRNEISSLPWSDTPLCPESETIREKLAKVNSLGYLTINSQPSVDGVPSNDSVFGWGPKNGYVYQKAYIEFFVSSEKLDFLIQSIADHPMITYYAVNKDVRVYSILFPLWRYLTLHDIFSG